MNEQNKPWWQSRTILSAIITVVVIVLGFFGVSVDEDTKSLMVNEAEAIIGAVVIVIGAVGSIYGRFKATKKIGK